MSPQMFQSMTIQQQEKVISVQQAQADLKAKEVDALLVFRDRVPAVIARILPTAESWPTAQDRHLTIVEIEDQQRSLQNAAEQYFSAKHAQALIELEQLQLGLKALKQMQSPIVGAHFTNR